MVDRDRADLRAAFIYLIISIVTGIAGAVYEHFSFGVYSGFMIYAFAIPLIGGVLPHMLRLIRSNGLSSGSSDGTGGGSAEVESPAAAALWNAAVATLTTGSILHGALQICGRPNSLVIAYPAAALALILLAAVMHIRWRKRHFTTRRMSVDMMPTSIPAAMPLNSRTGK